MEPYAGSMLQDVYAWVRCHPMVADGLLAAVLLACSADQLRISPLSAALAALAVNVLIAATVVVRRRDPVAAFAAAALLGAAQLAFGLQPSGGEPTVRALEPTVTDVAIAVLLYTLAAYRPRRISLAGLAVCLLGAAVAIARWAPGHAADSGGLLLLAAAGLGGTVLTAWVLGDSMAYRRAYYVSLEDRLAVAERARELEDKRARAVDESAARLRRIERDLHDGAQVRLAALAMTLGEIKENLEQAADDDRMLALVGTAHQNAKDTLAELRDLARGIHPPVLDRGLGPALAILAGTSAISVGLTDAITERPSPAIEAMAYFCAAELLANSTKHSGASRVTIDVREQDSGLAMSVTDDGDGGARLVPGGGLAGLLERVQTVDGRLGLDSPPGGPTIVTVELPRHA
jgi:signal transduction histidine kinase